MCPLVPCKCIATGENNKILEKKDKKYNRHCSLKQVRDKSDTKAIVTRITWIFCHEW